MWDPSGNLVKFGQVTDGPIRGGPRAGSPFGLNGSYASGQGRGLGVDSADSAASKTQRDVRTSLRGQDLAPNGFPVPG